MIIRDRTRLIVLLEFFTSGGIMLRELLHIGPVTIYGYGLMVAIGVISCVLVGMNRAKKLGVNPDILFNAAFIGMPAEDIPHNSILREFVGGSCFDV